MKLHAQNQLYTSFSFWNLKVLIDSRHAWVSLPHSRKITLSVCSFNRCEHTCKKITLLCKVVFEILKFKNLAIWLAESIFVFNSRTRLFPNIRFNKIIWVIRVIQIQKSTNQWHIFFAKYKKQFWGYFWALSTKWDFPQKSGSFSFLALRHLNFIKSFRKILWAVLEKTRLPTDHGLLTYWHTDWWNHRT